ncbi:MAG: HNH endonuclease domain-containing protein [Marinilabilia sp.]
MQKAIQEISTIIQRDSKDTTYKFALLKATIEIIQEYDHYIEKKDDQVTIPLGLVILKWIEYYYPIFDSDYFIPQKKGDKQQKTLVFRGIFNEVIKHYEKGLGYLQLNEELKTGNVNESVKENLQRLIKKLRETIVKMPMTYIGSAVNKGGEIFKYNNDSKFKVGLRSELNNLHIIRNCGSFSIPSDYYDAFKLFGSFINGKDSLIMEWLNFTLKADSQNNLNKGEVLSILDPNFKNDREVADVQNFYKQILNQGDLFCVWSGERIKGNNLNIDHVVPYSLWHNNDLWNLLPTTEKMNNKKRNKIVHPQLLHNRKELIIFYWESIYQEFPLRFENEIKTSLLGFSNFHSENWQDKAFNSLLTKCNFLVSERGLEPFNI